MDESQKDYPEGRNLPQRIIYSYDSIYMMNLEELNYSIYRGEKIVILDTSGEVGHRLTGM